MLRVKLLSTNLRGVTKVLVEPGRVVPLKGLYILPWFVLKLR